MNLQGNTCAKKTAKATQQLDIPLKDCLPILTQHALSVPGVGVPGANPVLHQGRDAIGYHVGHSTIHVATEVSLSRRGCADDVSHLAQWARTTGL